MLERNAFSSASCHPDVLWKRRPSRRLLTYICCGPEAQVLKLTRVQSTPTPRSFTPTLFRRCLHAEMALHLAIQDAILTEIARPEFSAALPPLSDEAWRSIVGNTPQAHKENERLEFLGDAMMYAALGHHLYTQIPDGTPGLFTVGVQMWRRSGSIFIYAPLTSGSTSCTAL